MIKCVCCSDLVLCNKDTSYLILLKASEKTIGRSAHEITLYILILQRLRSHNYKDIYKAKIPTSMVHSTEKYMGRSAYELVTYLVNMQLPECGSIEMSNVHIFVLHNGGGCIVLVFTW